MDDNNPYATPNAQVNDMQQEGFGKIKVFAAKGRIGRLRYFFYGMLAGLIGLVLIGISSLLAGISPILAGVLVAIIYVVMIVVSILLTIQRCHDFNVTGWLSLLLLVPLAPLIFYFIPGTKGSNEYGLMPPPNSKGVVAGSILLPIAMIVLMGIIGAVAIPAYQDYLDRAKGAQSEVQGNADDAAEALERLQSGSAN